MMNYGMLRVAACVPTLRPADIDGNLKNILDIAHQAAGNNPSVILFPELCVSGYTCADLFNDSLLLDSVEEALQKMALELGDINALVVVGAPLRIDNRLFNCAVAMAKGKILGIVPKTHLPNYNEFYERRWFAPASLLPRVTTLNLEGARIPVSTDLIFTTAGVKVGIEICEDLWVPTPPSGRLAKMGAEIILNLSASDELIGKHHYLLNLIKNQSARCRCAYMYASAGFGESSTDLAFTGNAIIAEDGYILRESKRFSMEPSIETADIDIEHLRHDRIHFSTFNDTRDLTEEASEISTGVEERVGKDPFAFRFIDPHPFVPSDEAHLAERCDEISSIQAWGLATRLKAINCSHAVIGISGGLDSTLALLVTVKAFDMLGLSRTGIIGVTMPGFGTTNRTKTNATMLMEELGVTLLEIPIGEAVKLHLHDIGHNPEARDVTYENAQARERTQILMDLSNQYNGIVVGTGDLSELALGWCTYNGDQMSMYGVNTSIPKTLVKYLVRAYALRSDSETLKKILLDVIDTPISPELLPADNQGNIAQFTEDKIGPYELHDFFLYHLLRYGTSPRKILAMAEKAFKGRYDGETILKWLKTFYRRFFSQQFKRSCMPDGVKVGSINLSPRGDWRMPSDASVKLWLASLESL